MLPKGHWHRIWLVLGAVDNLDNPTLSNIAAATKIPRASVYDTLEKIIEGQLVGVTIEKKGTQYVIVEWLDLRSSVSELLWKELAGSESNG